MEKLGRVSISIYPTLWRTFRMACVARSTSASKEIVRLIQEQLTAWQRQPSKESDHV